MVQTREEKLAKKRIASAQWRLDNPDYNLNRRTPERVAAAKEYLRAYHARKKLERGWRPKQPSRLHDRFWKYVDVPVDRTQCWNWTGSVLPSGGYGQIQGDFPHRIPWRAHRLSYLWFGAEPLRENKEIHHKCRNPRCVNPTHLEQLTRKEHAAVTPLSPNNLEHVLRAGVISAEKRRANNNCRKCGEPYTVCLSARYCKSCRRTSVQKRKDANAAQ